MQIRSFHETDYPQLAAIYEQGIATGMATFETAAPSWAAWDKAHLKVCRIAAFEDETMLAWAALSPVSSRCVYAGVAEVSIYVSSKSRGKGIGQHLLKNLQERSEEHGFWTLQAGVFPENKASLALHLKCGFRQIGFREKIGQLDGIWKDNVIFERRSKKNGI
ncbi:N-acetyltransferase family protein [Marinilongibacter aquaticus]|uniref:GNAT family N-acetyltransferase n=1 Tax=Marinilongibacter aquaticus TaxID=2975157 RepID=UPI0021BD5B96|nr:GNAT family N-acetyltransferase [Marinilongibacter aquaticus]UBM60298.1 N-acetyltransferase family protein [Marinilongibacter aquaticus]